MANLHPELHWTPRRTTHIAEDHFAAAHDWPVGLNYVMPWFRPTVGIALRDGVDELDATAAFEVYAQSAAARTVALATGETCPHASRPGAAHHQLRGCPALSRVVVPGAGAIEPGLHPLAARQRPSSNPSPAGDSAYGGGFASALENLAKHTDAGNSVVHRQDDRATPPPVSTSATDTERRGRCCSQSPVSRSHSSSGSLRAGCSAGDVAPRRTASLPRHPWCTPRR